MEIVLKAIAVFVLAAASLAAPTVYAQDAAAAVGAATEAANQWLAIMDAGKIPETWDAMAPPMQQAVTRETWAKVGSEARAPFGAVKSRKLDSAGYTRTLPNAPEGEYVVIRYNTDFAKRAGAVETVVPMRQPDGSWKVSGYYIR